MSRLTQRSAAWLIAVLVTWPATGRADPPPSLLVPPAVVGMNLNRTFPGVWEPLEAGATLVRAADPSAIWYNPAGIVAMERSAVDASAPSYEFNVFGGSQPVSGFSSSGLPSFVGVVLGEEVVPWRDVRIGFGVSNPITFSESPSIKSMDASGTRFNYTTNSGLQSFEALLALAYAPFPKHLRIGVSIGASYDQLSVESQTSSETAAGFQGSTGFLAVNANTEQFVSSAGVQYRPFDWLAIGGVIRPPPIGFLGTSNITYDSVADTVAEQQLHFNSGGTFALRLPTQLEAGITTRFEHFAFEGDLFWLLPTGGYTLLSSSQPMQTVTAGASGASPQVVSSPFPSVTTGTRSIVNGSVGGNYRFGERWRFHLGTYWSQAPTLETDTFFQPINFYGVRAGFELAQTKGPSGSIGLGYEYGHADRPIGLGSYPGTAATPTSGDLDIHTFSLLLALSYGF